MVRGFLVADWGTTNLRAWVLNTSGDVAGTRVFPDLGVNRLTPGRVAQCFSEIVRPALGAEGLPALISGMVGSNLGWRETPYLNCPVDAQAVAGQLILVQPEWPTARIVPGLQCHRQDVDAPDVMRGEEVQLLGWLSSAPEHAHGRHLVCMPGTHTKWARIEDGRIVGFITALSGELFDLLSTRSVLRAPPSGSGPLADAAFNLGLEAAGDGDALVSRLFTARSHVVGDGDFTTNEASAYLSGLLIGADVAACTRLMGFKPNAPVAIVGAPSLAKLYTVALTRRSAAVETMDGDLAALAGLKMIIASRDHGSWT